MNDAAREIANLLIGAAREDGYLEGPLAQIEELAGEEKKLFVRMIEALSRRRGLTGDELNDDEISSLFTFVYAKAAELVTNFVNGKMDENPSLDGMFDGKIPLYADDALVGFFKKCPWPTTAASAFLDFEIEPGVDPLLALFEALKWCFRISEHLAVTHLEERGVL